MLVARISANIRMGSKIPKTLSAGMIRAIIGVAKAPIMPPKPPLTKPIRKATAAIMKIKVATQATVAG
jgi:hypothetical protein